MTTPVPRSPSPASSLGSEAWQRARRLWPVLALIGFLGYFDFKSNGSAATSIVLVALGVIPVLLRSVVTRWFRPLAENLGIPVRFRRPAAVVVPLVVLYFARLKGTQSGGSAFLTMAFVSAFTFLMAARRQQIQAKLGSFYETRDRLLPRVVRVILVVAIPIFLTFLLAHGSLGDIGALFGGETRHSQTPGGGRIFITAVLSAGTGFLLLDEPQRQRADG